MIAVPTTAIEGQTFGKPGELVVLEPEKWIGHRFDLADHIDIGSQLLTGDWIVLLVHHDCDHCAAAVPRYVAEYGGGRGSEVGGRNARLAVIEMPPFGGATDPPPWQLPPSVLSGRLDQTRDWFATTPVALQVKAGIVIAGKEADPNGAVADPGAAGRSRANRAIFKATVTISTLLCPVGVELFGVSYFAFIDTNHVGGSEGGFRCSPPNR
jgi:hypothetical protein